MEQAEQLVVVERYLPRPGRGDELEAHLEDLSALASPAAGWLALDVVRPLDETCPEYVVLHRVEAGAWRGAAADPGWRAWRRRAAELAEVVAGGPAERHGMATWLTPRGTGGPVRWRMAVLSTLVIWPMVLLLEVVLRPVMDPLPHWAGGLVLTAALSVLLTYAVLPAATRALASWLHPCH